MSCINHNFRKKENKNKLDKLNGIIPLMAIGGVLEGFDCSCLEDSDFCRAQMCKQNCYETA